MKPGKITIMDIARRTGLSTGTVDRVLHNRGEVSRKSYDKVMKAIRDLGYAPNLYASLLSSGKRIRIAVLIPSPESGPFWSIPAEGVRRAAQMTATLGVTVETVSYGQHDLDSFREAKRKLLEMEPSGVVIAPMFRYETQLLADELRQRDIPYVFVDSKLEHDGYLAYFGMPMYESGYLCADQLTDGRAIERVLIIRILSDRHGQSDPTVYRRAGFLDYIAEHCPGCDVNQVFIDSSDPDKAEQVLSAYLAERPKIRHIVMFNSRIHLIVPYLEHHPDPGRRVIGFDNLPDNVDALRRGIVSVLIAQHPDEQVVLAIQALTDRFLLGKEPPRRDNYMHMDILTRYNADYY